MKKILENDVIIKTHRIIEIEEIEGTDFVFYKDTRDIDKDGEKSVEVYKGITSIENINSVNGLKSISNIVVAPKMYESEAIVAAISKENLQCVLNGEKHIADVVENVNGKDYPFPENYILVLWNVGSYKIADLHYNFISIPINFGYIDGSVDNERYDLEKLLEKLKKDKNVCDRDNLKISYIPYYNAEDGRNKSIEFKYLLPNDVYEKVANMNSFMRNQYILEEIIGADDCRISKD